MPTSDSTLISPPSDYTIILDIVSPKPMPPRLMSFDFARVPKNLNSLSKSYYLIPTPVSVTAPIRVLDSSSKSKLTVIDPLNVNLIAFPNRLKSICLNLFASELILHGTSLEISTIN